MCILRAPTRPKANAGGSWPQRVGGLTQPRGRCGHEGGLGVTGKGRGRISRGPPTLHIPLAASGNSTSVPRPPCPICERVSRPPLGSQRALSPTSSRHCVLLPFCYFAFQSEDALASRWLPMEAQSAKSGSPGLPRMVQTRTLATTETGPGAALGGAGRTVKAHASSCPRCPAPGTAGSWHGPAWVGQPEEG